MKTNKGFKFDIKILYWVYAIQWRIYWLLVDPLNEDENSWINFVWILSFSLCSVLERKWVSFYLWKWEKDNFSPVLKIKIRNIMLSCCLLLETWLHPLTPNYFSLVLSEVFLNLLHPRYDNPSNQVPFPVLVHSNVYVVNIFYLFICFVSLAWNRFIWTCNSSKTNQPECQYYRSIQRHAFLNLKTERHILL